MIYVIPTTQLAPSRGLVLSTVLPDGGRENCEGCAPGTLLEEPNADLIDQGLAEEGPPQTPPTTPAEKAAMIEGKDAYFIEACYLLGYLP